MILRKNWLMSFKLVMSHHFQHSHSSEAGTNLAITSCECERSFTKLKLIKTAHRSSTTATRLSGLVLMKINREKCAKIYSSSKVLKSCTYFQSNALQKDDVTTD